MKIKNFLFACVLSLCLVLLISSCGSKPDDQEIFNQAQLLAKQGKYKKAVIKLKKQLQKNSQLAESRYLLGSIYNILGDGASAEKELSRARLLGVEQDKILPLLGKAYLLQGKRKKILAEIKIDGAESAELKAKILYLRGKAYLGKSDYKQAETLFNESFIFDTSYIAPLIGLAELGIQKKEYRKAEQYLDKAEKISPEEIETSIIRGMLEYSRGRITDAELAYSKALERLPENLTEQGFRAITGLITVLILQSKNDIAKQKLVELRRSIPKHPYQKYLMAWLNFQEKKFEQTSTILLELQKDLPGHLPSLFLLGASNYALYNFEQANVFLTKFVNAVPTHLQGRKLLSMTRLKLSQPGKALEVIEGISEKDTELLMLAGQAAASIGNAESQLHYLKKAVEAEPDNISIRAELAKVYMQQGLMQEAIGELESIKGDKDTLQHNVMLIYAHLRSESFEKARALSQTMLEQNPDEPKLYALSGIIELTAGKRTVARSYFQSAIKQNQKYIPAYIYLGRMELEDGNLTDAAKFFEQVLLIDEQTTSAMLGLAQVAEHRGEKDQVIVWLERARKSSSKALLPRLILARYYLRKSDSIKALAIAQEMNEIKTDEYDSLLLLGRAQLQIKKPAEADINLTRLVELYPKSMEAYIELSRAKYAQQQFDKAKSLLRTAISMTSESLRAKNILINLELQTGNNNEALTLAKELQSRYKDREIGYRLEGDILMVTGQYVLAQKAYHQAFKIQPKPGLVIKLGKAYSKAGNNKDALAILTKGLGKFPEHSGIRVSLASLYQQQGNLQAAERHYEKVLTQQPGNVVVLNNLAILLTDRAPEKALTYAKQAYEMAPQSIAIMDTFGWLMINQGKIKEGVQVLTEALSRIEEPTIQYHRAVGLSKLGEKDQAIEQLRIILNTKVEFAELHQARQLLKQLEQN
ncbi:MAG: PEP-CTERM system TPR-repeat protein PrsT [Gammaproteobacteria bacterium]|nr:PEP-CTERM system TPR-repeat protein PrsT [Gammaproteobacteria bacterium]